MASFEHTLDIERVHSAYSQPYELLAVSAISSKMRPDRSFPGVYSRATLRRNGMVKRNDASARACGPKRRPQHWFVKYEVGAGVDGYVRYRKMANH